jgi:hypothetical protein
MAPTLSDQTRSKTGIVSSGALTSFVTPPTTMSVGSKIFFQDAPLGKTIVRLVAPCVVTGATRYLGPRTYWSFTPTQLGSSGNSYHLQGFQRSLSHAVKHGRVPERKKGRVQGSHGRNAGCGDIGSELSNVRLERRPEPDVLLSREKYIDTQVSHRHPS